jgi:hypothetical protein
MRNSPENLKVCEQNVNKKLQIYSWILTKNKEPSADAVFWSPPYACIDFALLDPGIRIGN